MVHQKNTSKNHFLSKNTEIWSFKNIQDLELNYCNHYRHWPITSKMSEKIPQLG